jgi:hypothetical protein
VSLKSAEPQAGADAGTIPSLVNGTKSLAALASGVERLPSSLVQTFPRLTFNGQRPVAIATGRYFFHLTSGEAETFFASHFAPYFPNIG